MRKIVSNDGLGGKFQSINNRITTSKLLKLFDFAAPHRHKLISFYGARCGAKAIKSPRKTLFEESSKFSLV